MTATSCHISPSSSNEGTSLLSNKAETKGEEDDGRPVVVQTLNGQSYALNPSRLDKKATTVTSFVASSMKTIATLLLSPIILTGFPILYGTMKFGPQWIRNKFIGLLVPTVCSLLGSKFDIERSILLKDNIKKGDKVLDVGCGGGAYMKFYANASHVVALEPIVEMHPTIKKSAKNSGITNVVVLDNSGGEVDKHATTNNDNNNSNNVKLTILPMDIETYLEMNGGEEVVGSTFDWIILGNVLCEVPNQHSTLDAVDTLLKVGGHIYFSEHIGCNPGTYSRMFQNLWNPIHHTISGGCNCNRDTLANIKNKTTNNNWDVIYWTYSNIRVAFGPIVLGLASKRTNRKELPN